MSLALLKSPAVAQARVSKDAAETALFRICQVPLRFERERLAGRLREAISSLYLTLDSDLSSVVHSDGLERALQCFTEAAALIEKALSGFDAGDPRTLELRRMLEALEGTCPELQKVASEVAMLQFRYREHVRGGQGAEQRLPPFQASVGLPQLHFIERAPLVPHVNIEPLVELEEASEESPISVAQPTTLAELLALREAVKTGLLAQQLEEARPKKLTADTETPTPVAPRYWYLPPVEESAMVRALARDALEDIGSLGLLREPIETEDWLDQAPFEQRLLNNLDYFATLGSSALLEVAPYHAEAAAPDVGRAFAVGFALGGIQGSDTVASIVSILKQSQPEEYPGYAAALRLAPNPAIDPALRELFTHANTGLVRLALEVLGARGTLTSGDVQLLLEVPDGELQILLARALASNLPDDLAIAHLERMLWSNDDSLYCAAVESLLRRGHSPAREALRECLRGSCSMRRYSTTAWYLCLAGTPNDVELLVDATRNIEREIPEQLVRVVRGLGRFGHAGVVPLLMLLLTSGDAEVASAAADSLEQIAGSGQLETVEVAWAITLPEPVQDREFPVPKRSVKRVTSDPATWNNWWRGNAQRFTSTIKYRHGRPFLPATVLDEVSKKGITCAVRDEAALELALMCGVAGHLDTRDWVARQQLRVESITESLRYLPTKPGAWHFGKTYNLAEPEVTGKYRGYP